MNLQECGADGAVVLPGVLALSYRDDGPWLIGDACAETVRIGLISFGDALKDYAQSAVIDRAMDRSMMDALAHRAEIAKDDDMDLWISMSKPRSRFDAMSYRLFLLLAQQCGNWPQHVEFLLHAGVDHRMAMQSPYVTKIEASLSEGSYQFAFERVEQLRTFVDQARAFAANQRYEAYAGLRAREDRFAQWQTDEGGFALGVLIVMGAMFGMSETSLCNDDDPTNDPVMAGCR